MDTITLNMENLSEAERKQLLSLVEKANKPKRFCLNNIISGESYFFIDTDGEVWESRFSSSTSIATNRFVIGNDFPTREVAEFEVERCKVFHEIKEFIAENDDEEINWKDTKEGKWSLSYSYRFGRVLAGVVSMIATAQRELYASSREVIEKMIEAIGEERIKKYYFGITE